MEGRGIHRSRDGDFQEPIVLPLAGRHTPVFLGALDKLHTHFVLSELHQEPRRRDIRVQRAILHGAFAKVWLACSLSQLTAKMSPYQKQCPPKSCHLLINFHLHYDVGFPSVHCKYVSLPLVNEEAALVYKGQNRDRWDN